MSIIQVENLTKKYLLSHQKTERYTTLRDTIAAKAKGFFSSSAQQQNSFQTKEEFYALRDVNFDVNEGDRVGIIGRNGAGKSTLLKLLSRITEPTSGRITIEGRVASLLEVGTGFHPELTGRENVFLNGSILGMSKQEIKSKFDEIVDFSGVEKFLDTPVKRYSSGMYVRLAFAVAAHMEPEILIVDEVLAVGDAEFQKKCLGKMKDVSDGGRTILFVSHNMEVIQKLCNKGILLQNGKLIASDAIEPIVKKYMEQNTNSVSEFAIPKPNNVDIIAGYASSVSIENMKGDKISEIAIGSPWRVRVYFTLNRDMPAFVIGIGMISIMDLPLRTTWSKATALKKGKHEAVFNFDDLLFTSGVYKLVIGLSQENITFHYVDNIVSVTISEVSNLIDDERILNSKSGLLLNQAKVDITSIN